MIQFQELRIIKMSEIKHDLNSKQKTFCDSYLNNGRNASAAYRAAFGTDKAESVINASASRLLRNVKVRDYIVKIQQQNAQITQRKQDINRDFLITEYLDVLRLSKENKQLSTARQTLDSLAHLAGLWTDRREVTTNVNIDATLSALDSAELLRALESSNAAAIDGNFREITEN